MTVLDFKIHACYGTKTRTETKGDRFSMWTLCDTCGEWWFSGGGSLRAITGLEFSDVAVDQ